jgi:excisionase family DNA binding protein
MPNRSAEHSLTLTVDEAATLLGVSRSTAYDLVATDELPTVRLRRRILVPAAALADLLGVSKVEIYAALTRLRGRTRPSSRPRAAANGQRHPEDSHIAAADHPDERPSDAYDEPQLW